MKNVNDPDPASWQFLEDDRFIKWVTHPDEETIAYWEKWMEAHPESLTALFKARELARDLAYAQRPPETMPHPEEIWTGIRSQIASIGEQMDDSAAPARPGTTTAPAIHVVPAISPLRRRIARYSIAASLLGLIVTGAAFFFYRPGHSSPATTRVPIVSYWVNNSLLRINQSEKNQVVYLVDGSRITLQPGSRIRHIGFLQKDKREVYLEGNAFFEVAKDATRPFFVYSNNLVVHVLGTSFSVTTNRANGDMTVLVRTGKVAISKKTDSLHRQAPLILTSNQKALYKTEVRDLIASVPDNHELATEGTPPPATSFNFEETPVEKIFDTLEEAYGIPLYYDKKTFSNCVITTSLGEETFEEKIKIVCEAIGASYRIRESGILIEGKPCK